MIEADHALNIALRTVQDMWESLEQREISCERGECPLKGDLEVLKELLTTELHQRTQRPSNG